MISSEVEGKQIGNKGYIEAKTYLTLSVIEITNDICLLILSWIFYHFWSYTIENFASPSFPKFFESVWLLCEKYMEDMIFVDMLPCDC